MLSLPAFLANSSRRRFDTHVHPTPPPLPTDSAHLRPGMKILTAALVIVPAVFMVLALALQSQKVGLLWLLTSLACLVWGLCILRKEKWPGIACIVLAIGQFGLAVVLAVLFRNAPALSLALTPSVVVASCQGDFQPEQPKTGWRYLWNPAAPLED